MPNHVKNIIEASPDLIAKFLEVLSQDQIDEQIAEAKERLEMQLKRRNEIATSDGDFEIVDLGHGYGDEKSVLLSAIIWDGSEAKNQLIMRREEALDDGYESSIMSDDNTIADGIDDAIDRIKSEADIDLSLTTTPISIEELLAMCASKTI